MATKCRQYELSVCPIHELEAAQKEVAPSTASARILRDSGADRFVTTAGAYLLNRFPMKGIQDAVGNAVVRVVLLAWALMECASNSFGKRVEKNVGSSYPTAREQQLTFEKALGAVFVRVQ